MQQDILVYNQSDGLIIHCFILMDFSIQVFTIILNELNEENNYGNNK